MTGKQSISGVAMWGCLLIGCGDGGSAAPGSGCDAMGDCQENDKSASILGPNALKYSEANEASNDLSPETTAYVLETEHGLAIEGSFEDTHSPDSFLFNSGTIGGDAQPAFPGIDIQVRVDGKVIGNRGGVPMTLDTVTDFGYSSLFGDYFINGALISGQDYVLSIGPSAAFAGKTYTIEIRGHIPED